MVDMSLSGAISPPLTLRQALTGVGVLGARVEVNHGVHHGVLGHTVAFAVDLQDLHGLEACLEREG